jgi:hypothetical protein
MRLLEDRINTPFAPSRSSEDARQAYFDAHDFLREVSRTPEAAERLRQGLYDYGLVETRNAALGGSEREVRLRGLGRVQMFLNMAQDNALTGPAYDDIRAASDQSGLGPSLGSLTDYAITHIPVAGTVNDIADGLGIRAGTGIDWLGQQLGASGSSPFDSLSDAEKIDRIRKANSRLDAQVWVAVDRFDSDQLVRDAARGHSRPT